MNILTGKTGKTGKASMFQSGPSGLQTGDPAVPFPPIGPTAEPVSVSLGHIDAPLGVGEEEPRTGWSHVQTNRKPLFCEVRWFLKTQIYCTGNSGLLSELIYRWIDGIYSQ
ncbi:unnamed protein product [Arctogadus glacialis]